MQILFILKLTNLFRTHLKQRVFFPRIFHHHASNYFKNNNLIANLTVNFIAFVLKKLKTNKFFLLKRLVHWLHVGNFIKTYCN